MVQIWKIVLKRGAIIHLKVIGFILQTNPLYNYIQIITVHKRILTFHLCRLKNTKDITLYTGGSV